MGSHERAALDLGELLEDGEPSFREVIPLLPHDHISREPEAGSQSLYEWFVGQVESQVVDRSPFKRLCYALLVEAISDLQRPTRGASGSVNVVARRDRTRALNWLNESVEDEEFSFPDVCSILFGEETDPARLRAAILKRAKSRDFNVRELLIWNS